MAKLCFSFWLSLLISSWYLFKVTNSTHSTKYIKRALSVALSPTLEAEFFSFDEFDGIVERETALAVCRGEYSQPIGESEGDWNLLTIEAHQLRTGRTASEAYFCVGFLEGFITAQHIDYVYKNSYADWFTDYSNSPLPQQVFHFLNKNYDYMTQQVNNNRQDHYWHKVDNIVHQLRGLHQGYQKARQVTHINSQPLTNLSLEAFLLLNADGDLQTITEMLVQSNNYKIPGLRKLSKPDFMLNREQKCSALIKLLDNELIVGHTTWDHYEMLAPRILKEFSFHGKAVSNHGYSMSSTPGFISSVDDFYTTAHGLVILETTNNNYNRSLWPLIKENNLLSWVRATLANFEVSAFSWVDIFSKHNSGTYNNQWMVIDTKKYHSRTNSSLIEGTFLIVEQAPGLMITKDVTKQLQQRSYWASYNKPYFRRMFEYMNYTQQHPARLFSHDHCPRSNIFRREAKQVIDLETFKRLLRFNNFEVDPESLNNACLSISSRCDLNPVGTRKFKLSGGMDAKIFSTAFKSRKQHRARSKSLPFIAQLGPTTFSQEPFTWSGVEAKMREFNEKEKQAEFPARTVTHLGQPDIFNFSWTVFPLDTILTTDATLFLEYYS